MIHWETFTRAREIVYVYTTGPEEAAEGCASRCTTSEAFVRTRGGTLGTRELRRPPFQLLDLVWYAQQTRRGGVQAAAPPYDEPLEAAPVAELLLLPPLPPLLPRRRSWQTPTAAPRPARAWGRGKG